GIHRPVAHVNSCTSPTRRSSDLNFDAFMGDRAPRADGKFGVGGYIALADPADANSPQVESVVEDFTAYKNRNSGIWARGELHLRSEEHTSELQSRENLVCRLLLE